MEGDGPLCGKKRYHRGLNGLQPYALAMASVSGLFPFLTRKVAARCIAACLRLYAGTWTYRVAGWPAFRALIETDQRLVGGMYHGRQLALWGFVSRPECKVWSVMVSLSNDGNFLSSVLAAMGWKTIRGSTARGGARALREAAEGMESGENLRICLAVDGSRGPIYVPKVGSLSLASMTKGWLICATACPDRAHILRRSWDQTRIPLPWARISLAVTRPIRIPENLDANGLKRLLPKLEIVMRRQKDLVDRKARRGVWR